MLNLLLLSAIAVNIAFSVSWYCVDAVNAVGSLVVSVAVHLFCLLFDEACCSLRQLLPMLLMLLLSLGLLLWLVATTTPFAFTTATRRLRDDAVVVKQMSFGAALRLSSSSSLSTVLATSKLKPNTKQRWAAIDGGALVVTNWGWTKFSSKTKHEVYETETLELESSLKRM